MTDRLEYITEWHRPGEPGDLTEIICRCSKCRFCSCAGYCVQFRFYSAPSGYCAWAEEREERK